MAAANQEAKLEQQKREIESELEAVIQKARRLGMKNAEIEALFSLIMEDETC